MNSIRLTALLGHDKVLERILQTEQYYHINKPDNNGVTALIWASQFGHEKVVQMLLDAGADVNAKGQNGTALYAASQCGHEKIVRILVDRGADVNAQGGHFGNALQAASAYGHAKVVQMLLEYGRDINAGDYPHLV